MAGTKNRLLFLLQYLLEHTDDVHTISADALMKVYENNGYKGSRNTIRDDIAALNEAGFEIAGDMRQGKRVYYIIDRRFELSELKMLVDAVSSCRFITKAKSEALIEKLTMMTNEENRPSLTAKVFTTDRIKTSNPTVSQTMDKIRIAIDGGKKVSFHYIDYTPEKKKVLRRDGHVYVVLPYAFIWNDDRYYLIAKYREEQDVVTFRIDRICDVDVLDEPADKADSFNPAEYVSKTVNMYDGGIEEQQVTIICENRLMQNIIDEFGEETDTVIEDSEHFRATITVKPNRTFFAWVFGFCGGIRIIAPLETKAKYESLLQDSLQCQAPQIT